ncbi:fibronectin type III domain-containing protein [Micromonospora sp. NPDC003197]
MANVTCVACGHDDQGDSSYCVNPTCGALLAPVDRTLSGIDTDTDTDHQSAADRVESASVVAAGAPAEKRAGRRQFVIAAALVTIAALTVSVVALLRDDDPVAEIPRTTSGSMSPEMVAQVVDHARPTEVEVRDEQTAAVVRWASSNQSNEQRLVQVVAAGAGMRSRVEAVPVGNGEFRVDGLDPNVGYCFRVGVVVFWDSPAVVTWSEARCVRGATWRSPVG